MMQQEQLQNLVAYILEAQDHHYEIAKITASLYPELSLAEAYLVQEELIRKRLARGEHILGPKMGLTSLAKLQQMQVHDPVYGYLLDTMLIEAGQPISLSNYIHPKAEPEIGLILKQPVKGPDARQEDVLAAVEYIFPAIEIIDSRYRNFDFTVADVIADNTSAAGAILGTPTPFVPELDLAALAVTLTINGQTITQGKGSAVLGHPANSVACLANLLAARGQAVPAGQPILTGALTAAAAFSAGDHIQVAFDQALSSLEVVAEE